VGANTDDRLLLLQQTCHPQDVLTSGRICPLPIEISQKPTWLLHAKNPNAAKPDFGQFFGQVLWAMKVCGDEVPWIACVIPVLAIGHSLMTNRDDTDG
jgi:hypothetical protein